MKRLNNKGITLVELVVTFAIAMVLIIGMMNVIVDFKDDIALNTVKKDLVEYQSSMTYLIENDLIKKKLVSITDNTTDNKYLNYTLTFQDNTNKVLIVDLTNKLIKYDNIIYDIPDKNYVEFRDKAIFYDEENVDSKNDINISLSSNILYIYIPYFNLMDNTNMGLDIIHPINL